MTLSISLLRQKSDWALRKPSDASSARRKLGDTSASCQGAAGLGATAAVRMLHVPTTADHRRDPFRAVAAKVRDQFRAAGRSPEVGCAAIDDGGVVPSALTLTATKRLLGTATGAGSIAAVRGTAVIGPPPSCWRHAIDRFPISSTVSTDHLQLVTSCYPATGLQWRAILARSQVDSDVTGAATA